jgi:hypothetical protein
MVASARSAAMLRNRDLWTVTVPPSKASRVTVRRAPIHPMRT